MGDTTLFRGQELHGARDELLQQTLQSLSRPNPIEETQVAPVAVQAVYVLDSEVFDEPELEPDFRKEVLAPPLHNLSCYLYI